MIPHLEAVQKKAEVLIEALPYIRQFNRKLIVVKYGGSAMENAELKKNVIQDVTLLKLVGFKPIIVHGGGKEISHWSKKLGLEAHFVGGHRVTDGETMDVAEMVLSKVNKSLVAMIQELGVAAAGISGKDGGLLRAKKKMVESVDIGQVGEIEAVNPKILHDLIESDFLPVVAPIGYGDDFGSLNINADDAACQIARAVGADKLVFLTDVDGLYGDFSNKATFISRIGVTDALSLLEKGLIDGGMLPKLKNCIDAIDSAGSGQTGVGRVHILDGRIPHCLLLEIFTKQGIGTAIVRDDELG